MDIRIQHALQGKTGLPADRFINTFHCTTLVAPLAADLTAISDAIKQFYKPNASAGFSGGMADVANGVGETIKIYNLADAEPRAPIHEWTNTAAPWTNSVNKELPSEVAICLSYQGEKISGVPQARRRGRIYIGPLNEAWIVGTDDNAGVRPPQAMIDTILIQADSLRSNLFDAGAVWCVYSPTNDTEGDGGVESMVPITQWWIDDAFDVQRRRGNKPSRKFIMTIGPGA